MSKYVSISCENPILSAAPLALAKVETMTAPYPNATKAVAMVMLCQEGVMSFRDGNGPRKMKDMAKMTLPITETIVGYLARSHSCKETRYSLRERENTYNIFTYPAVGVDNMKTPPKMRKVKPTCEEVAPASAK